MLSFNCVCLSAKNLPFTVAKKVRCTFLPEWKCQKSGDFNSRPVTFSVQRVNWCCLWHLFPEVSQALARQRTQRRSSSTWPMLPPHTKDAKTTTFLWEPYCLNFFLFSPILCSLKTHLLSFLFKGNTKLYWKYCTVLDRHRFHISLLSVKTQSP